MFKNNYEINGGITKIFITQKNGTKYTVLIDTEDLQRLKDNNFSIYVRPNRNNQLIYPLMNKVKDRKNGRNTYTSIQLNRFLLNASDDVFVDHINHNTMDHRKKNLRAIEPSNNSKNRNSHNKNNKSGYRNVCLIQGWWCVQLTIDGKNRIFAKFKDVNEAGTYAETLRNKYYGTYAGNS